MNCAFPVAITGYSAVFASDWLNNQFGGQPADPAGAQISRKLRRYMSDATPLALQAVDVALDRAAVGPQARSTLGLYTAQYGYLHPHVKDFDSTFRQTLPASAGQAFADAWQSSKVSPFVVTQMLNNNLLGTLSLHLQQAADCAAIVRDELAGAVILEEAAFNLQQQYCQQALVVCAGALDDIQRTGPVANPPSLGAVACVLQSPQSLAAGQLAYGFLQHLQGGFCLDTLLQTLGHTLTPTADTDLLLLDLAAPAQTASLLQQLNWPASQLISLTPHRQPLGCPGLTTAVVCGLHLLHTTSCQRFIAITAGAEGYFSAAVVQKDLVP